jgi:hypothetical protein
MMNYSHVRVKDRSGYDIRLDILKKTTKKINLLCCSAVQSGRSLPTFQKYLLPQSRGQQIESGTSKVYILNVTAALTRSELNTI